MKTKYIKQVLMCEPNYFSVDYSINPWMKIGSVNQFKAKSQWNKLVESLLKQKIKVEIIKQQKGLPDMVFAADQAIIKGKQAILSNFKYRQRQKEVSFYKKWFEKRKFEIKNLPPNSYLEGGGETFWWNNSLLAGTGFRTSKSTIQKLRKILNTEVYELELVNPKFYHLDTCLFPLNDKVIFYYPLAFSNSAKKTLKKLGAKLIPIDKKEAYNFAANSLVTDHHVIVQQDNPHFANNLKSLGYQVIEKDMSEFVKAGGGIHCLVNVLEEYVI